LEKYTLQTELLSAARPCLVLTITAWLPWVSEPSFPDNIHYFRALLYWLVIPPCPDLRTAEGDLIVFGTENP
jgi:hypothetical protein